MTTNQVSHFSHSLTLARVRRFHNERRFPQQDSHRNSAHARLD